MTPEGRSIAVLYDGLCPLCQKSVRWLRRLDRRRRLEFVNARERGAVARRFPSVDGAAALEEIHIVHPGGRTLRGFDAYRSLLWVLPWTAPFAPLFYLPGVAWIGRPLARALARRRMRIRVSPHR